MADEDLDPNLLNKLRVVDLREHLTKRGLPTSGLKADLVKRLREAILSELQDQGDNSEEAENVIVDDPNLIPESNVEISFENQPVVRQEVFIDEDENTEDQQIASNVLEEVVIDEQQTMLEDYEQAAKAEQERLAAEEQHKIWKAEQKRLQIEELQRQAEEEERRKLAELEKIRIAEEEKRKLELEEMRIAEEKMRQLAEEENRKRIEEQQRIKAEEERKMVEEQQKRQAEEERKRIEEEQRRKAEEKRKRIEEEQRRKAEEERKRVEEQQRRKDEEEKKRIEEEERKRVEEEQRRKVEEEQRRKAEEEQRKKAEEEQRKKAEEEQRKNAEEEQRKKVEEEQRKKAEEEQRKKAEIEERRKAEEEQRRKAEEETKRIEALRKKAEEGRRLAEEIQRKRAAEEQRMIEEEQKRAEEEQIRRDEEERRRRAEEEQRRRAEEQRRKTEEEQRRKVEEERRKRIEGEQKKRMEDEKRRKAEEQRKRVEEEMRRQEEDDKRKAEEDRIRRVMEERNRMADEEQRRMLEEQENQLRWAEQQQRQFAEDEHKMLLAEEQQRLLEEEQMIVEGQKLLMGEQQQQLLEQQKQLTDEGEMLRAQQKLIEQDMLKEQENDLLKLQQQAIKEKEEEQRIQQQMTSHTTSVPPPIPGVLLSHPQQMISGTTFAHSLTAPLPPIQSSQIHLTTVTAMNVPPPQTILMSTVPTRLSIAPNSAMNIMTHCPPPNITLTGPPPRFTHPPPPPVTTNIPTTIPMSTQANQTPSHLTLPPQSVSSSLIENDVIAPGTSESLDSVTDDSAEIKLPQALEKVLALKTERAQLLGVDPDSVVQPVPIAEEKESSQIAKPNVVTLVTMDEDEAMEEDSVSKSKESKGRRRKKKKKKHQVKVEKVDLKKHPEPSKETSVDIDIEYVQDVLDIADPLYSHFVKIFEKFKLNEADKEKENQQLDSAKVPVKQENVNPMALRKKPMDIDDDDDDEKDDDDDKKDDEKPKLSKRKLKKLSRMSVAELKQKVIRPELVEMHDVTARDPILLLHLKASRNTVPVPRHWCFKRKYLQGKRGIEKPAFELPDFIKRTGIMEMRQALQEKEDQKTMKAKMRERVRPKMGKIDIDYQKLHDAFFKWQTKPRMTIHGDLYYEGKEFETRLKEKKPGDLSEDLRTALGMPTGPNANKCPPPWLIAMQRYGPPPSYPNLKIPGLNAPIPDSCSFGYHAGGWGKPPVDETGRPLYGDVFGTQMADNQPQIHEEEIDHTLWGELESESSEEEVEDDEEEDEEEEEKIEDETGLVTPAEGLITPSGFSSIPAGMETPDMIELRKRKIEAEMEGGETPALYTILPEKKTERVGAAMMGSTHIYDLAGAIPAGKIRLPGTSSVAPQGIEVALDPSELELDTAAMAARYEQTMREQQSQLEKEDLSDMVAEHAARQKNKRKKQQMDSAKPPKKYKEFKF